MPSVVDVNGRGAVEASICMPRMGAWHVDAKLDSLDDISGPVTVTVGGGRLVLSGTVMRGAEFLDAAFIRIVGGAGRLGQNARPRNYNRTSLSIVVNDLLSDAGEELSPSADPAFLHSRLSRLDAWTTVSLPIGRMITHVLDSISPSAAWRVLPDGSVWVGVETWPDSGFTEDVDFQRMDEDPRADEALLGAETPFLLPGTTLSGRRVSYVEHSVDAEGVRTRAWFE